MIVIQFRIASYEAVIMYEEKKCTGNVAVFCCVSNFLISPVFVLSFFCPDLLELF